MNEDKKDPEMEKLVAEYRKKIRNGKRTFSKADWVAARLLKVDLAELIEEEKEEVRNERYAG